VRLDLVFVVVPLAMLAIATGSSDAVIVSATRTATASATATRTAVEQQVHRGWRMSGNRQWSDVAHESTRDMLATT
jgi:hypothetical protein